MRRLAVSLGALMLFSSCDLAPASDPPEVRWWDGRYPEDCAGLDRDETLACAEAATWDALQWRYERRADVHAMLGERAAALEATGDVADAELARLYWRRVQLAVALFAEDASASQASTALAEIDRAHALDPTNLKIEAWARVFHFLVAYQIGPDEFARERALLDDMFARFPDYTLTVVMGTSMALPLETGVPQEIAAWVERFDCSTHDWCDRATAEVPFNQAGIELLFAEIHARVGDRELAVAHLERSLAAPRVERWPYRYLTEARLADVDGWLASFAARGDAESVLDITENNGPRTCVLCHGPPSARARR